MTDREGGFGSMDLSAAESSATPPLTNCPDCHSIKLVHGKLTMSPKSAIGPLFHFVPAVLAAMLAATAHAQIFVGDNDVIGEYTDSGTPINTSLISGLNTPWSM